MLEDLGGHDPVELAVGERQGERVALLHVGLGTVGHLAGRPHGREEVADPGQLVGVLVEGDHVRAAAVHLERVPSGAAAEVEHPLARPQAEAVEVNGEHAFSSNSSTESSYAAAVAAATARQLNSSCDPAAAGRAVPGPALGVVEQGAQRGGQLADVPGRDAGRRRARRARPPRGWRRPARRPAGWRVAISSAVGSEKPS